MLDKLCADHTGGLVGSGAKGQTGINLDGDISSCFWQMSSVVNDEAGEDNRIKAFLFPLLVPVSVFRLADGVGDIDVVEGEIGEGALQGGLVEQLLLHIAF